MSINYVELKKGICLIANKHSTPLVDNKSTSISYYVDNSITIICQYQKEQNDQIN